MKKRILVLFMVVAMLLATSVSAFAVDIEALANEMVATANAEIDELIADAQLEAEAVESNGELKEIIAQLVEDTNGISEAAIEKAAEEGIILECVLVKVEIGHKNVKIDPLVVGGW
ncbi:hypothetical protein SAMN02745751_01325 [Dethiosulfatibacter aminovorans DSM 17477]|uniref:Uncharacterized protein n=1 Tax=Dethiosulfatibacter aminovorans DSM 17477 TaxID=1121476 RepID=A0A1M6F1Z7_9FIRM|nr:hypothetical protein [Dethiosulfatibacter aminovorans]SHI91727.1 hypothetical protein SAMN02745751_01325 [Dethiosulfatibacter aminovorans DSM 17477]